MSEPYRELHSYSLKRNLLGRAAVLVVISFLLVILIYSSAIEADIFAAPKTTMTCFKVKAFWPGAAFGEACCLSVPGQAVMCQQCDYDTNGNQVGLCTNYTPKTGGITNGQTSLPGRLGTLPPSSGNNSVTPGNTSIFLPLRNATNAAPGNTSTGTLAPGGIFKVTPGTTIAPGNNTGPLPAQTITKEHNPASPNVFSPAVNTTTNASSNTNNTGH